MASDTTKTTISNTALAWIGANKRLTAFATDTSIEAIQCRLHYDKTRLSLLRHFPWSFARRRKTLSAEQSGPPFEYDARFKIPEDYLCMFEDFNESDSVQTSFRGTREGDYLLANSTTIELVYIADVTEPSKMDDLFIEALELSLAVKLSVALAGTARITQVKRNELRDAAKGAMDSAKNASRRETDRSGRSNWNLAKFATRTTSLGGR